MPVVRISDLRSEDRDRFDRVFTSVARQQAQREADRQPYLGARPGADAEWTALGVDREGMDASVVEYEGPEGKGFEVIAFVERGGQRYRRRQAFGPGREPRHRSHDWRPAAPDDGGP